jgi:hypothetical protein
LTEVPEDATLNGVPLIRPKIALTAHPPARSAVLQHYGAVAMPCVVQDPDRKGKVESGVGHAKKTPLKGLRFESLEEAQAYLDHWEERWAGRLVTHYLM